MRKTVEEVRAGQLEELGKKVEVIAFIRTNVMSVLEKMDGKKVNKRMSTAVQKKFEGDENVYIADLTKNTDYKGDIIEGHMRIGLGKRGYREDFELAILLNREEQTFDYEKTISHLIKRETEYRDKLMKLSRFDSVCVNETASQLDELLNKYTEIVDTLTYEQKILVGRSMKNSVKWMSPLGV